MNVCYHTHRVLHIDKQTFAIQRQKRFNERRPDAVRAARHETNFATDEIIHSKLLKTFPKFHLRYLQTRCEL